MRIFTCLRLRDPAPAVSRGVRVPPEIYVALETNAGKRCAKTCVDSCPDGFVCAQVGVGGDVGMAYAATNDDLAIRQPLDDSLGD